VPDNLRTTLDLDEDVLAAARRIAAARSKSLGQVVSELARRGLQMRPKITTKRGFPVFRVPNNAQPLTLEDVRRDEDEG
jgi:hypothetical protein